MSYFNLDKKQGTLSAAKLKPVNP